MCGSKNVFARSRVKGAKTWGGLQGGNATTIRDFIEKLETNTLGNYFIFCCVGVMCLRGHVIFDF